MANSWREQETQGRRVPKGHLSFVYGKDLVFLGGEENTQEILQNGRTENGEWNDLRLNWATGTGSFNVPQDACVAKLNRDKFIITGGTHDGEHTAAVTMVNMKEESVEELGSLIFARSQHACAIMAETTPNIDPKNFFIIVTGGLITGSNARDERFDLKHGTSRELEYLMIVPRFQHRMINLGGNLYALGGQQQSDGLVLNTVELFDTDSESWSTPTHPTNSTLMSKATSGMAITALPLSAVACSQGCQCGAKLDTKIIGGAAAKVRQRHVNPTS